MSKPIIQIESLKFDGTLHRAWEAELIERSGPLLFLRGHFQHDVAHSDLGHIAEGTESFEYYWTDRWYNVFRFHDPDGSFRSFYCNINMPPVFEGDTLRYVDLDLDLLIQRHAPPVILDREEFEANAAKYGYGKDIRSKALQQLEVLRTMIRNRDFPFDTADGI